ncbi:ornithine cyclodeaminase [Brachybacterium endophyticum]|uniref:Ornithine cyclodeaminase n=1 Tax=Brachybacterium endophyticum TaxID=2182385 RepID=A0A2U2RNU2_9MICO|nr:ornithine cyclodeaminase [Brachybacterium endophyticum]PWH07543.1 ornithine cyclodeaminase [Brachybacterium endophyticum]
MTQLLDVANMARWIQRDGAQHILTTMTERLQADFARWQSFERIPRIASHTPFGVIELMPTSDGVTYSFKYVNGHPSNPARGFQTVTAFGVLADVDNGYPVFLAEMTLLTALRTAAASAMAARALARPDSRVLALIGAGSQSEFQALAFRGVLGIEDLRVFDIDPEAVAKVRRNLEPLGFRIHEAASAAEATLGADVITTCTADKAQNHVLDLADVQPGVHINAIGGDCPGKTELDPRILEDARVFVEFTPQTRIEGEIQQMAADFPVTELWEVLTGSAAARTSAEEITVFDSVGFAISDFSALCCAREATGGTELVSDVDLVASPEDPKDLFSLVTSLAPIGPR